MHHMMHSLNSQKTDSEIEDGYTQQRVLASSFTVTRFLTWSASMMEHGIEFPGEPLQRMNSES